MCNGPAWWAAAGSGRAGGRRRQAQQLPGLLTRLWPLPGVMQVHTDNPVGLFHCLAAHGAFGSPPDLRVQLSPRNNIAMLSDKQLNALLL